MNKEALSFRIHDKNIYELSTMDINELYDWLMNVDQFLSRKQQQIAVEILKEIRTRLKFLLDVGLDYLSLDRSAVSLSGRRKPAYPAGYADRLAVGERTVYIG